MGYAAGGRWVRVKQVMMACAMAFGAMPALAQYTPPKLPDGKTPDFRGIWQPVGTAYINVEGHPAMKGIAASSSIVVGGDGRIPYKPQARAIADANGRDALKRDPHNKCWMAGPVRASLLPKPIQIVESPDNIAFVYVDSHSIRLMYKAPRPHFDLVDWYMGDSRYHWEGDVLVTDVTSMMDTLWLDAAGHQLGKAPRITERYTLTGPNTMSYEATITNPEIFTRPFTMRTELKRDSTPTAKFWEDECLDNADHVRERILPTDPHNVLVNNYRRWAIVDGIKNGTIK